MYKKRLPGARWGGRRCYQELGEETGSIPGARWGERRCYQELGEEGGGATRS